MNTENDTVRLFDVIKKNIATKEKLSQVNEYLNRGIYVDVIDSTDNNNTPLHIAAINGDVDVLKLLLDKGANATITNGSNKTAIDIIRDSTNSNSPQLSSIINRYHFEKLEESTGVEGHLYETKLLCLILLRALCDDHIEEFVLGTNINRLGVLDDIVVRFKTNQMKRSKIMFIQAKHRNDPIKNHLNDDNLKRSGKFGLQNALKSYLEVMQKVITDNDSIMFEGTLDKLDCEFIIYTNAKDKVTQKKILQHMQGEYFIKTSDAGKILEFTPSDKDVEELVPTVTKACHRAALLAKTLVKFILSGNIDEMMKNNLIKLYHIFLVQKVIEVEIDVTAGTCQGKFQQSFLKSNDINLLRMKSVICEKIANLHGLELKTQEKQVKKQMELLTFQLPMDFDKIDFCFNGDNTEKDKGLDELCNLFQKILQTGSEDSNTGYIFVKLDADTVGPGKVIQSKDLDCHNFAGLVGNLLISDDFFEMLKFNLSQNNLSDDQIKILNRLKQNFNLSKFRFNINICNFPKLSLNSKEDDRKLVNDFLSKLKFYTDQATADDVEDIVIKEIFTFFNCRQKQPDIFFRVKCSAIFLAVHDKIQKWWKQPKKSPYLTKTNQFYYKAEQDLLDSPMLQIIHTICIKKIKNTLVEFEHEVIHDLNLDSFSKNHEKVMIIGSDLINFTSMKVIQYFDEIKDDKNYQFINLDSEIIVNCLENVKSELESSKISTLVLITQEKANVTSQNIKDITKLFKGKIIIITDHNYENISHVDNKNNFKSLSSKVREMIFNKRVVMFQNMQFTIGAVFNDDSLDRLNSELLRKLIENKNVLKFGKSLTDDLFDQTESYYLKRRLYRYSKLNTTTENELCLSNKELRGTPEECTLGPKTLKEFPEKVVIISAEPGMGKSILLTSLAIKTKEKWPTLWILKINLRDNVEQLSEWKNNETNINLAEAMSFLYMHLSDSSEEIMFDYFYNQEKIAVLFDGFDEVCPEFVNEVIHLLCSLQTSNIAHLFITSRPHSVLKKLELALGIFSYTINPLTALEQICFLQKRWAAQLLLDLSLQNIPKIIDKFLQKFYTQLTTILSDENGTFTSIPLHLYMIAEVFEPFFKKFINSLKLWNVMDNFNELVIDQICRASVEEIKINSNLIMLYGQFVHNKYYLIRFGNKQAAKLKDLNVQRLIEQEYQMFVDNHRKLAASLLLDINIVFSASDHFQVQKFVESLESGLENTGVSTFLNHPKFTHFTFAEYFVLEFIFEKLICSNCVSINNYLINYIFTDNSHGIDSFLNSKLELVWFGIIKKQHKVQIKKTFDEWMRDYRNLVTTAFIRAIERKFIGIIQYLVLCLQSILNKENLLDCIQFQIRDSKSDKHICVICTAMLNRCTHTIQLVVNLIKNIDRNKLTDLFYCGGNPFLKALHYDNTCFGTFNVLKNDPELIVKLFTRRQDYYNDVPTAAHFLGMNKDSVTFSLPHLSKLSKEQLLKIFSVRDDSGQFPLNYAHTADNHAFSEAVIKLLGKEEYFRMAYYAKVNPKELGVI